MFPTIATRQDEDSDIRGIDFGKTASGLDGHATHRLDWPASQPHNLDFVVPVSAQFRERMRRFPISEAGHGEEVDGLGWHVGLRGSTELPCISILPQNVSKLGRAIARAALVLRDR